MPSDPYGAAVLPAPGLNAMITDMLQQATMEGDGFLTGRQIVTYKRGAHAETAAQLENAAGVRVANAEDFGGQAVDFAELGDAGTLMLPELGVAIMATSVGDSGAVMALAADDSSPVEAVEPETFVFHMGDGWQDYLRGFAAASDRIRQDLLGPGLQPQRTPAQDPLEEAAAAAATWGLAATRVTASTFSGRGIRVAILDTGLDLHHPDFAGRSIVDSSFIAGATSQDGHGHGTHTCGTACGPRGSAGVPRYGTAGDATIYVGKVLSNAGSSVGGSVLAGMNWAVANRCVAISMSLGGGGGPFDYYTRAGTAALDAGCLIIAASGNSSHRPGMIAPTGSPANSPTIMSVAAVDERLGVAPFSCGGKVDIAGPGVNVFSTLPMPRRYGTLSGTSMATPHVSGIAALYAQSNPSLRGRALWAALTRGARPLPFAPSDVGAGLVQAP